MSDQQQPADDLPIEPMEVRRREHYERMVRESEEAKQK